MQSLKELLNNYKIMKVEKKISVQGDWIKLKEDVDEGDLVEITDAGQIIAGDFGDRHTFKVETAKGDVKNMSFNQTSMNYLIDVYGGETEKWIGKKVKVWIVKSNVAGKLRNIAYLTAPNWIEGPEGYYPPTKDVDDIPVINEEE